MRCRAIALGAVLPACALQPAPSPDDFAPLHRIVIEAAAAPPDRDALWSALDQALTGEARTALYAATWAAAVQREARGARVTVDAITHDPPIVQDTGPGRVELEVGWVVRGTVHHGAHAHVRENAHRARVTLVRTPDGPRIAALHPADSRRRVLPLSAEGSPSPSLPAAPSPTAEAAPLATPAPSCERDGAPRCP
jgi:hypothetical protein